MPKKGTVVCQTCNANFTGQLPNYKRIGYNYISPHAAIDGNLKKQLQEHHSNTSTATTITGEGISGHKYFDVFLEDGSVGDLEANSYAVIYTERGKGGKER